MKLTLRDVGSCCIEEAIGEARCTVYSGGMRTCRSKKYTVRCPFGNEVSTSTVFVHGAPCYMLRCSLINGKRPTVS